MQPLLLLLQIPNVMRVLLLEREAVRLKLGGGFVAKGQQHFVSVRGRRIPIVGFFPSDPRRSS